MACKICASVEIYIFFDMYGLTWGNFLEFQDEVAYGCPWNTADFSVNRVTDTYDMLYIMSVYSYIEADSEKEFSEEVKMYEDETRKLEEKYTFIASHHVRIEGEDEETGRKYQISL